MSEQRDPTAQVPLQREFLTSQLDGEEQSSGDEVLTDEEDCMRQAHKSIVKRKKKQAAKKQPWKDPDNASASATCSDGGDSRTGGG